MSTRTLPTPARTPDAAKIPEQNRGFDSGPGKLQDAAASTATSRFAGTLVRGHRRGVEVRQVEMDERFRQLPVVSTIVLQRAHACISQVRVDVQTPTGVMEARTPQTAPCSGHFVPEHATVLSALVVHKPALFPLDIGPAQSIEIVGSAIPYAAAEEAPPG